MLRLATGERAVTAALSATPSLVAVIAASPAATAATTPLLLTVATTGFVLVCTGGRNDSRCFDERLVMSSQGGHG